jgi:hypothetical protein
MEIEPQGVDVPAIEPARSSRGASWHSKLLNLCFIIFCFEIGVFLVVFPWLDYWDTNNIAGYSQWLGEIWGNPYFRGALSGVGLANIYISFLEILRLIRGQIESTPADQLK